MSNGHGRISLSTASLIRLFLLFFIVLHHFHALRHHVIFAAFNVNSKTVFEYICFLLHWAKREVVYNHLVFDDLWFYYFFFIVPKYRVEVSHEPNHDVVECACID